MIEAATGMTFYIQLVRYTEYDNGDYMPVPVREWHLPLNSALELFAETVKEHPDAFSDSGGLDSIEYKDTDGTVYSMFVVN